VTATPHLVIEASGRTLTRVLQFEHNRLAADDVGRNGVVGCRWIRNQHFLSPAPRRILRFGYEMLSY
jgi:hypothetical protein